MRLSERGIKEEEAMKRFVIFSLAVLTTGLSTVPAFSEDLIPTALSFDLCPFSRSN